MTCRNSNIILIGMPGCGKSTLGKKLSNIIKWSFFDSDILIEEKTKATIADLFKLGEEHFRDIETSIIEELSDKTKAVISTGGGVVKRKQNVDALKQSGTIIFINRSLDNILNDIDVSSRPLLANKRENLIQLYKERLDLYKKYCNVEILNDGTMEETLSKLLLKCKEMNLL